MHKLVACLKWVCALFRQNSGKTDIQVGERSNSVILVGENNNNTINNNVSPK